MRVNSIFPQWEPRSGFRFTNDVILTSPAVILDLRPDWLPEWVRSYGPVRGTWLWQP